MRRYSPPYHSPPRRGYGGRTRSPPRRGPGGGYGRNKEQNSGSLLVRNIPLNCRSEELRGLFERFGVVRDVYLPKDYYSGYLLGERYLWLLLQRQGKGLKRCAEELGPEDHQDMEVADLIMDDLGPVQYRDPGPPVTLLVLERVIAQGPFLLLQDVKLTTLFRQVEDVQSTQDHQEILQKSEMVSAFAGRILQVMALISIKMAIDMTRKLHTNPMKNKHAGRLHVDEHLDHLLDLDLGLLICHPGTADRWKARWRLQVKRCGIVLYVHV
ncbi:Serine/arginine-rich SC35-like splicing factor [Actinidia chinensis var. chinensis]|uniref:Serine/arginine-rich SC35-like splicing factor n=1 Tax=Actinidia chinensis var. chinensis TaxID=1590841 RepID=A0A2R6RWZ1_ACTCC|nr:Serine/arginine-rich SC35-like splicing factor [Actinidia chinensis var. chinensis]